MVFEGTFENFEGRRSSVVKDYPDTGAIWQRRCLDRNFKFCGALFRICDQILNGKVCERMSNLSLIVV